MLSVEFIAVLLLTDTPPLAFLCFFIGLQVPRLKHQISCSEQGPLLFNHVFWFENTLTAIASDTFSVQKFAYDRTADVCPSRSVPSAKTTESMSLKQSCRAEVASLVHTLTDFMVGLCLQLSDIYAEIKDKDR